MLRVLKTMGAKSSKQMLAAEFGGIKKKELGMRHSYAFLFQRATQGALFPLLASGFILSNICARSHRG
jgi:hypothetical protein